MEELYTISKITVLIQWGGGEPQPEKEAKETVFRFELEKGHEGTFNEELRIKGIW